MKILVAEDDPTSLLILRKGLERLGHECIIAQDGTEAWQEFLVAEPDVLITDWMMPGMDGPELVKRIRASPLYCYVVMLTALADDAHALAGMSAGADGYLIKPLDNAQLRLAMVAAERVTALHRALADREADLEALNGLLEAESRRDALTGVGNRLRMKEDLAGLDDTHRRYGRPYALALVDVDQFKSYNDEYGHLAGDVALRSVSDALTGGLRTTDHVYRFGGEELLVVFPEQDIEAARSVMERLRRALVAVAMPHRGNPPFEVVTISIGVAAATAGSAVDVEVVLRDADRALYAAKDAGRNRVEVRAERPLPA